MTTNTKAFAVVSALAIAWIAWPRPLLSHEVVNTTVTFDREIIRVINKKCIACHSEGNLGIPLTSYEQTRPWARAIEEEVLRRHMPPWRAVPGYGHFVNDIGLTNRELQFLVSWIEGNGPKNKEHLIVNVDQTKTPISERLKPDFAKWQLGRPDLLKALPANSVAPGQPDEIRQTEIDLGLTSDQWIRGLEFQPGDRRVVRAAFFSVQGTGQWLGSWTPWYGLTSLPADTAYLLPAGARIVAEIHYRSANQAVEDRGTLALYFAPAPAAHTPAALVIHAVAAPSGSTPRLVGSSKLQEDVKILAFKPDVKPGVESIEVTAKKPDGTVQVLLLIRGVLPEWPTPYIFDEPIQLPKGTELTVTDHISSSGAPADLSSADTTISFITVAVAATPTR